MSITRRGRTECYDNVSIGEAAGRERTILAQTPSTELIGGGTGSSTSTVGASSKGHSNPISGQILATSNPADNIANATVTLLGENVGTTTL